MEDASTAAAPIADDDAVVDERLLLVSTLTDQFEVSESVTSSIGDLRTRLQSERFSGKPVGLWVQDSGQELTDDRLIGELVPGQSLLCVVKMVDSLEARLGELEPPGDAYQKYLRRFQNVETSDPRVLRSLWAISMLESRPDKAETELGTRLDEVTSAALLLLGQLWSPRTAAAAEDGRVEWTLSRDELVTKDVVSRMLRVNASELVRLLAPHYSPERHERLLTWLLETPDGEALRAGAPSPRLRVVFGEVDQILVREPACLLKGQANMRQAEAFQELVKAASASSDALVHMGAFGQWRPAKPTSSLPAERPAAFCLGNFNDLG